MTGTTSLAQAKGFLSLTSAKVDISIAAGQHRMIFHVPAKKSAVHLRLGKGSMVHFIFFSTGTEATFRSTLQEHASVHWHMFTLGSGSYDLASTLIGSNATSQINWIFRASKKERQTINIRNAFHAKNGGGEIVLKGVAEDRAEVACNGMIEIGLRGTGTKTHLTEEVLMLDSTAKVDAVPGLEIKTNDVKASHSATVSRVTPEQLFYLRSRGLPEEEARKLFIDGFLGEMIGGMPNEALRKLVSNALRNR